MAKYLWQDEFCTGNPHIDEQHRQLFRLLDKLYEAICAGSAAQLVEEVVAELVVYTRSHFYQEESLMREANYPGLEEHQREHQRLLAKVDDKMASLRRGDKVISIELLEFINEWLGQHIIQSDCRLTQHLR